MNLKQLHNFIRSVEAGNITRAAEHLHISQTALGLQLRNLEADLGLELLVRHSRGISVTKAGALLYQRGTAILKLVDQAKREVTALGNPCQEHLSLGLTPSIMRLVGADLMVSAKAELPGLAISFVERMSFVLQDILQQDEIDLALIYDVGETGASIQIPLLEEKLLLITAPGGTFPGGPVRFRDAVASSLALASDRDHIWRLVHGAAAGLSLGVNIAFDVQSIDTIKTLVSRGVATSIVPYGVCAEEIARGLIEAHTIEGPPLKRTLYLVGAPNRRSLKLEEDLFRFIDRIVDTLAERSPHAAITGRCIAEERREIA